MTEKNALQYQAIKDVNELGYLSWQLVKANHEKQRKKPC